MPTFIRLRSLNPAPRMFPPVPVVDSPVVAQAEGTRIKRRKRRSKGFRRSRFPGCALHRPGRFFRKSIQLAELRQDMDPFELGECDWLLYRRRASPWKLGTRKEGRYRRGFRKAKADFPKPDWPPINW